MANRQSIAIPKASKRTPVDSARKRAAKENAAADKLKRAEKKAATKARKELRAETADDNLLVGREGESPDFQKLRDLSLRLEAENERLKAKIQRRDERDAMPTVKTVPEPQNKGEVDIETIRGHLNLNGEENDVEWSMLRHAFRALLVAAGLNWDLTWSKQDIDKINTLIHAAGTMKRACPDEDDEDEPGEDTSNKRARLAEVRKAAAHRAAARLAARRKAEAEATTNTKNNTDTPRDDEETEPEDLPEAVRKAIEREEIGVPATDKLPAKSYPGPSAPQSSMSSASTTHSTSNSKPRALIYMRRGRGGKVVMGRKGRSGAPVAEELDIQSMVGDDRVLSDSSGQTSSG
ncbi:hypothetical protein FRC11_004493, partial [Ceratobasidium sp. 423]